MSSSSRPTILEAGSKGQIVVMAVNVGDAPADGGISPVVIVDQLPAGVKLLRNKEGLPEVEGIAGEPQSQTGNRGPVECSASGSPAQVACTFAGTLPPYDLIELRIKVEAQAGMSQGLTNEVDISGGEAVNASIERILRVGESSAFGVDGYELVPEEEGGVVDTQAGSHPFQLNTTLLLNQTANANPVELTKDLHFAWPRGLIGNPTPFPQCSLGQFLTYIPGGDDLCPPQTAVGVAMVTINEPQVLHVDTLTVPLFNLEPSEGEPARFGFSVDETPVFIDPSIRTGGDYGVTVSVSNISQTAAFLRSEVIAWGVPDDPRHDSSRGWGCLEAARGVEFPKFPCNPLEAHGPPPLLSLPTTCEDPFRSVVMADSWGAPSIPSMSAEASYVLPFALDGCNRLPFSAAISVKPDGVAGSSPTGLGVGVHVPQEEALNATGLAPSQVRNTTVALPAGVVLNPAAGDGLLACSLEEIALESPGVPSCPDASKIGTVEIKTPLLPNPLVGAVYVAAQAANPFGSLVALYLFVEDHVSGIQVKLAGETALDPVSGQLVTTFKNTPQAPFEDLKLHFFGGNRAPLGTPALCGTYTTTASIEPWSGNEAAVSSSRFDITSGPNGSPCQDPLSFAPSLAAGSTNLQAGAFTPFSTTMDREDGNQSLQGLVLHLPPGLSGLLSNVKLCGEAEANAGTCGLESLIGETTVSVGLGGDPFSVKGGRVYITGPYEGAPFGLSIVNPAKAGPYDLEKGTVCDCLVVRAKIEVDPHTAALIVSTDEGGAHRIPTIIAGIPLQIKHVNVTITRRGFTFNPTNCSPLAITGDLRSAEGASATLTVPFQVTNCATLKFAPKFFVSTKARHSKAAGASLRVRLDYPTAPFGSQANIATVKVDLPKQLPSRLTTLQQACTAEQFDSNPAGCPAASVVGHGRAITPLVPVPLEGPAYFVSHGGEAFPSLNILLQGYGVTIDLVGNTSIRKGITSSTFKTVPDAPVGSFELTLPQGPFSALAALGNLCKTKLAMPTAFTAQDGAVVRQHTKITVTGCRKRNVTRSRRGARGRRK